MLEWTGERFLPWIGEATIAYEHLHRYAYASMLVKNRRVVDLACGEGYGTKILAASASSVVGIDIDETVIQHASEKYGGENIRFLSGSITEIPVKDDHCVDVVVCFEAIEHIENHEALLAEVKRILTLDGTFIVSTPNKAIYSDEAREENPFHVKELYFEEIQELLARHFATIRFLGQRIHPASFIWPIGETSDQAFREFLMEHGGSDFHFIEADKRVPLYFIAVASNAAVSVSPGSVLLDESDSLFKEKVRDLEHLEQKLREREDSVGSLEQALKWREDKFSELKESLEWEQRRAGELEKTIASQREALSWRAVQVSELERDKQYWERETIVRTDKLKDELKDTERRLDGVTKTLADVEASSSWKFMMRLRTIADWLKIPRRSTSGNKRHLP